MTTCMTSRTHTNAGDLLIRQKWYPGFDGDEAAWEGVRLPWPPQDVLEVLAARRRPVHRGSARIASSLSAALRRSGFAAGAHVPRGATQ